MRTLELTAGADTLSLPRLVFGTGSVGSLLSYEESAALLDRYRNAGGNCIDTARMYGGGASEETLGAYLARQNCRKEMVISTKGGFPPKSDMRHSRIRPAQLQKDLEESLRALRTDVVDIYFLHRDDPDYPVEELMPFLDGLVRAGKVRVLGASNWTAARIDCANRFAQSHNLAPFSLSQIQWSLAEATPARWKDDTIVCMDDGQAAFYRESGMPVMAFTPLTRGFFSKSMAFGPDSPELADYADFQTPRNLARVRRLAELCKRYGATPTQICHAYLTCGLPEGMAVLGAKKRSHLEDSLGGADFVLTDEDLTFLRADDAR